MEKAENWPTQLETFGAGLENLWGAARTEEQYIGIGLYVFGAFSLAHHDDLELLNELGEFVDWHVQQFPRERAYH